MKISGMMIYYYFVCKRKLWYYINQLNMEQNSELVAIGKILDENSYKREKKGILIDETINVEFIKNGCCRTYIKNKQNIENVEAKSLPVGILNDVDFSVFDKDMRDGDIFIMCSDGILDSNPDQDDDKWLLKLIKEINTNNVKKMADIILNEAIDNGYGILKDDMSVIVAKVVKI